eukprot:TRINITY_DN82487_c0_g1_i1.p1 TRINITY_DN82487_c0_g1~~TRINITY_DN82487_c0_g1_i1.p1  ORF type:complete len:151 (-),score=43.98 TRINITY_DN82487_c0_g1_i1:42-494(-)
MSAAMYTMPATTSVAMPATTSVAMPGGSAAAAAPMVTTVSPVTAPAPMMMPSITTSYGMPFSAEVDHSKGKWFMPGEALPEGFIPVAHPQGLTAPEAGASNLSEAARESFVVTGGAVAATTTEKSLDDKAEKTKSTKKKSSKKKKSSGCC